MAYWYHHWTCSRDSHLNKWHWPAEDRPERGEPCWLQCDSCKYWTEMIWQAQAGGWQPTGKTRLPNEGAGWYGMQTPEGEGREECPHHTQTPNEDIVPGWTCPFGCGAFVR